MTEAPFTPAQVGGQRKPLTGRMKSVLSQIGMTLLVVLILAAFLTPFVYGVATSLKTPQQVSEMGAPWFPASKAMYIHNDKEYDIYQVPTDDGIKEMALVKPGRDESVFVDPAQPGTEITWQGRWRTLERVWAFDPVWANFTEAWDKIDFVILIRNTLVYAIVSTIGAVSSAAVVAYGFSRFPIPKKGLLFMIVLATIILPPAVTLIPTYALWNRIELVGTWYPLIIPAFFANGYNIFLLRQFFMGIPRELDDAATIDGAGPIRVFLSVILPQSVPALVATTLFHFFFCWNDFFLPLVYLAGHREKNPISVGLTGFNQLYTQQTNLIQAAALIAAVLPLLVFFFAQRTFMQGIVMTGVEK
jgi:multiple sugar transport system permease protein